jgi:hypothetical protein
MAILEVGCTNYLFGIKGFVCVLYIFSCGIEYKIVGGYDTISR